MSKAALVFAIVLLFSGSLRAQELRYTVLNRWSAPASVIGTSTFLGKLKRFFTGETVSERAWKQPLSVARVGDVFIVSSPGDGGVWVMDRKEKSSTRSAPDETLATPVDIACSQARCYVSDSSTGTVWSFGVQSGEWSRLPADFTRPTGLHVDPSNGYLYVVDTGKHTLSVWDGVSLKVLVDKGLNFPTDVALLDSETILVADSMDHEIECFSIDGAPLFAFGQSGSGTGSFAFIRGVGTDRFGNIYVSDVRMDWIQVFDRKGTLLTVIGGDSLFSHPSYFDISGGILLVASTYQNQIVEVSIDE